MVETFRVNIFINWSKVDARLRLRKITRQNIYKSQKTSEKLKKPHMTMYKSHF